MICNILLQGLFVGIMIAAPFGPTGMLCVKRAINYGVKSGIISGLGAASADAIFAAISGFGLTAIINLVEAKKYAIQTGGGILLILIGIITLIFKKKENKPEESSNESVGYFKQYITSFFLTLTNPITIIAVAALMTTIQMYDLDTHFSYICVFITSVFLGSALWFLGLSFVIAKFVRDKVNCKTLYYINSISSILFIVFGVVVLIYR